MSYTSIWQQAQLLRNVRQRHELEEIAFQALLATLRSVEEQEALRNNAGALAHLCEHGNRPGWAYACGYTVKWFPTRGAAKHAWYQDRSTLLGAEWPGPGALGPKPKSASLLEALVWGNGNIG